MADDREELIDFEEVTINEAVEFRRALTRERLAAGLAISEADASAETRLAREDVGWIRLGGSAGALDLDSASRTAAVKRARTYAKHDPLCRQIISLYTNYALGQGVNWRVPEKNQKTKDVLSEFWDAKQNQGFFSAQGQRRLSNRLLIDGEHFLALFLGTDPSDVKVRPMDPLQITEIASDPEDEWSPRYYKREFMLGNQPQTRWYRDWRNEGKEDGRNSQNKTITDSVAAQNVVVYHVMLDSIGKRGDSVLLSEIDWVKAHRQFMRSRVSIQAALAQFAWDVKLKGGQKAVDKLVSTYQSGLATASGSEDNPPAAAGSTWVGNEAVTRTPIQQETGAHSAQVDGAMLLQMVGVGAGIFPHYFGAGEAFRLATTTQMEAPMLKAFLAYRQLWRDVFWYLFKFVMERAEVPADEQYVDIDFPEILSKDIATVVNAIWQAAQVFPNFADSKELQKLTLMLLGLNDPDEVLAEMEKGGTIESNVKALMIKALREVASKGGMVAA